MSSIEKLKEEEEKFKKDLNNLIFIFEVLEKHKNVLPHSLFD